MADDSMSLAQLEHLVSQLILGYAQLLATIEALMNFTMARITEEESAELTKHLKKAQSDMVRLMREYTDSSATTQSSGTFARGNPPPVA